MTLGAIAETIGKVLERKDDNVIKDKGSLGAAENEVDGAGDVGTDRGEDVMSSRSDLSQVSSPTSGRPSRRLTRDLTKHVILGFVRRVGSVAEN
jgi:hypothetical protein